MPILQNAVLNAKQLSNRNWKSLSEIIEEFKNDSQKIFEKYNLQYTYKFSQDDSEKISRSFLFYDYESHHVLERRQNLVIDVNNNDKANWLKTVFYNNPESFLAEE